MGKPSAPTPPDPQETAGAQTATNIGTAIAQQQLNNINQVTPYGSLTYTQQTNPNYDPNFQAPTIEEIVSQQTTGGSGGNNAFGASTPGGEATTTSSTSYRVGDQTFDSRDAAQGYVDSLNPQYQTYTYTDPNTGQTHEIPLYTATQTLSPEQQAIFDQSQGAQLGLATMANDQTQRISDLLSTNLDTSGAPGLNDFSGVSMPQFQTSLADAGGIQRQVAYAGPIRNQIANAGQITRSYGGDFSQDRQRVEDAIMSRVQPGMDRNRQATEARLAAQGIRLGSEAYSAAQDDLSRAENDARMQAVLAGGQEQSRMVGLEADRAAFQNQAQGQQYGQNANDAGFFNSAQAQQYGQNLSDAQFANAAQQQAFGQELARAQFGNQALGQQMNAGITLGNAQNSARAQYLNELFGGRNQSINEITALLSGGQVQNPNFVNTNPAQLANTDYAGIVSDNFNQQMQNYNAQMGAWSNGLGAIGSLLRLSDRRAKTDIKKIGKTNDGQQIYSYRYKSGGPIQMGLMAQEVEKRKPEAVANVGGIKMVDYGKALS